MREGWGRGGLAKNEERDNFLLLLLSSFLAHCFACAREPGGRTGLKKYNVPRINFGLPPFSAGRRGRCTKRGREGLFRIRKSYSY